LERDFEMNKILPFIALSLIIFSCDPEPIVEVCVNYPGIHQSCGTGFFIERDTILTSAHLVAKSDDGEVVIKKRGRNIKSESHHQLSGRDIEIVFLEESEDVEPLIVCDTAPPLVTWIEFIAVYHQYGDELETAMGALLEYADDQAFVFTNNTRDGFSGGPMMDYYNNCVMGVTKDRGDGYAWGYLITDLEF
jgi:hypothetical protein